MVNERKSLGKTVPITLWYISVAYNRFNRHISNARNEKTEFFESTLASILPTIQTRQDEIYWATMQDALNRGGIIDKAYISGSAINGFIYYITSIIKLIQFIKGEMPKGLVDKVNDITGIISLITTIVDYFYVSRKLRGFAEEYITELFRETSPFR